MGSLGCLGFARWLGWTRNGTLNALCHQGIFAHQNAGANGKGDLTAEAGAGLRLMPRIAQAEENHSPTVTVRRCTEMYGVLQSHLEELKKMSRQGDHAGEPHGNPMRIPWNCWLQP